MTSAFRRSVWDKRCTGKDNDEIIIISEGQHPYSEKNIIDYTVVFHQSYLCFELVIFANPSRLRVWTRFFLHQFSVFEKVNGDELERILEEKRQFFRKRHRHFTPDALEAMARNDIAVKLIQSSLVDLINYDLYQRILNQSVDHISQTIYDLYGNPAEYKSYDLSTIALLSPKPDCLVPVNCEKIHMEAKYKQYMQSERLRRQVKLALDIMQSNLKSKPFKIEMVSRSLASTGSSGTFFAMIGSIRASISAISTSQKQLQYSETNHSKYPVETPNTGLSEKIRRRLSGLFSSSPETNNANKSTGASISSSPFGGSSKVLPGQDEGEIDLSPAKRRWLKATNRVITRNLHGQMTETLKEKNMLPDVKSASTGPALVSGIGGNTTSTSPMPQLAIPEPSSFTITIPVTTAAAATANSGLTVDIKQKPDEYANRNSSIGRRLMNWAGLSKNSAQSPTQNNTNSSGNNNSNGKAPSPARSSMKRDPSMKSVSSNNSVGSQPSMRKFKTQYPLSHQVGNNSSAGGGGGTTPTSASLAAAAAANGNANGNVAGGPATATTATSSNNHGAMGLPLSADMSVGGNSSVSNDGNSNNRSNNMEFDEEDPSKNGESGQHKIANAPVIAEP